MDTDLAERVGRLVLIYNPGEVQEETSLTIHHLSAQREFEVIMKNRRIARRIKGKALAGIRVEVPPRSAIHVEAVPSRQPSTCF